MNESDSNYDDNSFCRINASDYLHLKLQNSTNRKRKINYNEEESNSKKLKLSSSGDEDIVDIVSNNNLTNEEEKIELEKLVPMKQLLKKKAINKNLDLVGNKNFEGRLLIDKVILENFKSYLGERILGCFDSHFTSVIGSNGSGKSNIIDAFLFAFDYTPKKIRMRKYSELIHNSSRGNPDFAKVTIFFKRIIPNGIKSGTLHLFNISRSVYKNNKTKYHLCGKEATKNEIKLYLKEQGIGLDHDRFLILQGEVENISLLKPKAEKENEDGMLEFLDDIIGTSTYKETIEELSNAVSEMYKEVILKNAKSNEAERSKMALFDQVISIIKSVRIGNIIIDEEYKINCFEIIQMKAKINDIQNKLEIDIKLEEDLYREEKRLDQEIKDYNQKRCEKIKELENGKNELEMIRKRINNLANEQMKNRLKQESTNKKIASIVEVNEKLSVEIEKMTVQPKKLNTKKNLLQEKLENVNLELNLFLKKKNEAEEEFTKKKETLYDIELDEKDSLVQEEKSKMREIIDNKNKVMIKLNELSYEKKSAEDVVGELEKDIKIKSDLLDSICTEYNFWKDKVDILNNEILSEEEKCRDIDKKVKLIENEMEYIRKSLFKLKNDYYSIPQMESEPADKIYKYLSNLHYKGFRGRLGDLSSVDKKYDIALSTLGGKFLDNYVVNTVEDAQYLLNKLKVNNIGKGSFMVIEKIATIDKMNKKTVYPLKSQRAFDLLNIFDPDVNKCFYFVLQESLVINTIDEIEPLRKALNGKFKKIITLDGIVVENSGKMTGGGKPLQGKIGAKNYDLQKITMEEKVKYETNIKEKENRICQLQEEYKKLLTTNNISKSTLKRLNFDLETYLTKIISLKNTLETNQKTKELLEIRLSDAISRMNAIKVDKKSKKTLENQIDEYEKIIFEREKCLDKVQNEYNIINNKVLELREQILGTSEKEYNEKLENMNLLKKEISEINKILKKLEHRLSRTTITLHNNEEKFDEFQNLLNSLNIAEEANENRMSELKNLSSQYNELVKNLQDNFISNKNVENLRKMKNDINHKLLHIKESIEKNHLDLSRFKKNLDKLKILKNNAKYIFLIDMTFLSDDVMNCLEDECFFNKRIYEAEKEFIEKMKDHKCGEEKGLIYKDVKPLSLDEITNISHEDIENIKKNLNILRSINKVSIDPEVISEFIRRSDKLKAKISILNEFKKVYDSLKRKNEKMIEKRLREFNKGFDIISKNIKRIYQQITFGGDAEIEPIDKFDPYNYGIIFKVRPPEKCWKKIMNLSGGEKTLASLSLVFALHSFNPTPLYIMDEVDAALDFRNVRIIAEYINERTENAQFIVISLRKEMYEQSSKILGVWKLYDSTYCLIQKLEEHNQTYDSIPLIEEYSESRSFSKIYDNLKTLFM